MIPKRSGLDTPRALGAKCIVNITSEYGRKSTKRCHVWGRSSQHWQAVPSLESTKLFADPFLLQDSIWDTFKLSFTSPLHYILALFLKQLRNLSLKYLFQVLHDRLSKIDFDHEISNTCARTDMDGCISRRMHVRVDAWMDACMHALVYASLASDSLSLSWFAQDTIHLR